MRHVLTVLVFGLSVLFPAIDGFSQPSEPRDIVDVEIAQTNGPDNGWIETTFCLSAGYRKDNLNWHIAGNLQGTRPNVRSELTWSDLEIIQFKLSNRSVIKNRFYLRGHLIYGAVLSGDNRDSDYNGDDRTQEFSRSLNGVDGNHVWDGSLGVGPRFSFFNESMVICPMLGYAVSEQDLNIVDGYQAITTPPATTPIGPIPGLDSRYQTRWKGPWLGVDLLFSIPCQDTPFTHIGLTFTGEYHWVDYDAEADWNLRTDFRHPVSFAHFADGSGFVAGAALLFKSKQRWGINVGLNVKEMTTDSGLDRIYFANNTIADTRLNEVRWRSFTFEAGVSYQF